MFYRGGRRIRSATAQHVSESHQSTPVNDRRVHQSHGATRRPVKLPLRDLQSPAAGLRLLAAPEDREPSPHHGFVDEHRQIVPGVERIANDA